MYTNLSPHSFVLNIKYDQIICSFAASCSIFHFQETYCVAPGREQCEGFSLTLVWFICLDDSQSYGSWMKGFACVIMLLSWGFIRCCLFLVASFTFYLANTFPELGSAKDTDDNVISFVPLDNSESPFSGRGYEDPAGALTVSNVTSDGFDLSWESNLHIGYDSYTVELKDFSGKWNKEVHLNVEVNDTIIRGLRASTEYQVRLYGISNNQRSSLLETVAVTGINYL